MDFKVADRISYTGNNFGVNKVNELGTILEAGNNDYTVKFDNAVGAWSDYRLGIGTKCGLYISKNDKGLELVESSIKVSNIASMQIKIELDQESIREVYDTINELQEKLNNLKLKLKF
jgi:hypothetical protein